MDGGPQLELVELEAEVVPELAGQPVKDEPGGVLHTLLNQAATTILTLSESYKNACFSFENNIPEYPKAQLCRS